MYIHTFCALKHLKLHLSASLQLWWLALLPPPRWLGDEWHDRSSAIPWRWTRWTTSGNSMELDFQQNINKTSKTTWTYLKIIGKWWEHLENCCQRFWNPLPLKGIKPHLAMIQRYSLVAHPNFNRMLPTATEMSICGLSWRGVECRRWGLLQSNT